MADLSLRCAVDSTQKIRNPNVEIRNKPEDQNWQK
jgi:hypothetical protein